MSPEAEQALRETQQVYSFGLDVSYGAFPCFRFPATRIGDQRAELAQFGVDCGARVDAINGLHQEISPGRGYKISGLRPELGFIPDRKRGPNGERTFSLYYETWPYGRKLDDLPKLTYWFSRTMFGITGPRDDRHYVQGEHYTIVAVNQQPIGHYNAEMLYFVPTDVWEELFAPTLIRIDEYDGPTPDVADVSARGVNIADLYRLCGERGKPMFNLGWADNYSGTLVNAGTPQMPPFHEWERERQGESVSKFGHIHKSHMLGGWKTKMSELAEAFVPLQEGHTELFNVVLEYRYARLVLQQYLANWHLGQTLVAGEDEDGQMELEMAMMDDDDVGPYAGRMLWYAYDWYNHFQSNPATRTFQEPILFRTKRTRWGAYPIEPVLDTRGLSIFDGSAWDALPPYSNGRAEFELEMYTDRVLRRLQRGEDLRFLDRKFAGV